MRDWCLIPTLDAVDYTEQAVVDCLAQTGVDPAVLIVDNGGTGATRDRLNQLQLKDPERVMCWFHDPPLPSLSATWNRMLSFVWAQGGESALVVNNDVRLNHLTYDLLRYAQRATEALFVSAVGVTEAQFAVQQAPHADVYSSVLDKAFGGPDFSCFVLTKAGHEKYPFDEAFVPAYCEDLDMHRHYMLGGDGDKIFSVNLPYLHYASRTLNQSEDHRRRIGARIDQSRAYYKRKWGGDVNQERFIEPFTQPPFMPLVRDPGQPLVEPPSLKAYDVTTPTLQRLVQAGEPFPWQTFELQP